MAKRRKPTKAVLVRRVIRWHIAEFWRQHCVEIDNYPAKYIRINQCSCCGTTEESVREIIPGPGLICKKCWLSKPCCIVPGCDEIALRDCEDKCRGHYFDYEQDEKNYREAALRSSHERDYSYTEEKLVDNKFDTKFHYFNRIDQGYQKAMKYYRDNPDSLHLRKVKPPKGEEKCG